MIYNDNSLKNESDYSVVFFIFKRLIKKRMNIEELRAFCLSIPLATEDMPFKDDYLMFRVYGKWFAVISLNDTELKVSVKCDPDEAIELRERYISVSAAWHFNKKYWNSITINSDVNDEAVKHYIKHSVQEVVKKLPKKLRNEYELICNKDSLLRCFKF